jgi:nucleoid DNA-binding protein
MKATKTELIDYIQSETGCKRPVAAGYADCVIQWLAKAVAEYETIELRGLGTFEINEKPEHANRFDKSKMVPAQKKVKFRPGRTLQEALKGGIE